MRFLHLCAASPSTERGTIGNHVDTQGPPVSWKPHCPCQGPDDNKNNIGLYSDAKIEDHINKQYQTPNLRESASNIFLLLPATKILIKLNV